MKKKLLSLLLVLCFITQAFPYTKGIVAHAYSTTKYYDGFKYPHVYTFAKSGTNEGTEQSKSAWEAVKNNLPSKPDGSKYTWWIIKSGKYYGFNFTLWYAKGIIVYGNAYMPGVNPRLPDYTRTGNIDFKAKVYYPDNGKNTGYYDYECTNTMGKYDKGEVLEGEFRYHGYDATGNSYSNTSFPPDGPCEAMNEYTWVKNPWDKPAKTYTKEEMSIWNGAAIEYGSGINTSDKNLRTANWISKLFKDEDNPGTDEIEKLISLEFPRSKYGNTKPYEYINVMSPPSILYPGEGRLWTNIGTASRPKYRYRTAFIRPVEKQNVAAVTLTGKIKSGDLTKVLDKGIGNKPDYLSKKLPIELEVSAKYEDDDIVNDPVKKVVYYYRADIDNSKGWKFTLKDTDSSVLTKQEPTAENRSKTLFKTSVTVKEVLDAKKAGLTSLSFPAAAKVSFIRRFDDTQDRSATGNAIIKVPLGSISADSGRVTVKYMCVDKVLGSQVHEDLPLNKTYKYTAKPITGYQLAPGEKTTKEVTLDKDHRDMEVIFNYIPAPGGGGGGGEVPGSPFPPPPKYIQPNIYLPEPAFDIVQYKPSDNTKYTDAEGKPINIVSKEVLVNGTPVGYDHFFSGTYVFGETGYDRLANIVVIYTADDGSVSTVSRWIRVLNTKPRVQLDFVGKYKQNRKMAANNTSVAANTPEVIQVYPIDKYTWKTEAIGTKPDDGTDADIRTGTASDMLREFTFKKPGTYRITLIGENTLGRVSDPYVLEFEIQPDIAPAVICEHDNISIARGETIKAYSFESVSTDGDGIENTDVYLYYDANNDGTPETLVNKWTNVKNGEFPQFTASKLGFYRWKIVSKEKMLGDMIPEHVTADDAQLIEKERDFWVDNYVPQTAIYSNIPVVRPNIDVFIMTDARLPQSKIDFVKNSRMDFNNYLRQYNILPVVEQWDMKTYTYSQPAVTTMNTGRSYPPETTAYASNGYSGTLTRTSVSDNGSNQDFGGYQYRTESQTFTDSCGNWIKNYGTVKPYTSNYSDGGACPDSKYINSNGYSGSIPRTGTTQNSDTGVVTNGNNWTRYRTFTASYAGTLSKTVSYWVSDWRWVPNYTGFYSGTIYKDVREPFIDTFRPTSDKYVIYVTDGNISELNDLKMVLNKSGAKLLLVSAGSAASQITPEKLFVNDSDIAQEMNEALQYIADTNKAVEQLCVLAGTDTFDINVDDFDQENDPIIERKFQYVQDANYFDNTQGMEAFAVPGFSDTTGWTDTKVNRLNKVGKYTIYRRIKDNPSSDPKFPEYSYYSGTPMMIVLAHRKPIASATLDWDFDANTSLYNTTWVDHSYDLDHQFNRADKGVVERKIMFRQAGGDWLYVIPDKLVPGTYELQYYVKDPEGAWSDPFTMNFSLNPAPPMQFDASLRTLDRKFSLSGIPASEYLELYDVWTRFPYNVYLTVGLYSGNSLAAPVQTIYYAPDKGVKNGNDIEWNNIHYRIPASLPDGTYTLRITAVGEYNQKAGRDFMVSVYTPVWEDYSSGSLKYITRCVEDVPDSIMLSGDNNFAEENTIRFVTGKYAQKVKVQIGPVTFYTFRDGNIGTALDGTGASAILNINNRSTVCRIKNLSVSNNEYDTTWSVTFSTIEGYPFQPEQTGTMIFTAYDASDNWSTANYKNNTNPRTKSFKTMSLKLSNLRITNIADYGWKKYFVNSDGSPAALQKKGIGAPDMPVYKNKDSNGIKLGYKVSFKMDTVGLNNPGDIIKINARYYVLSRDGTNIHPASIFIEGLYGAYIPIENSEYRNTALNIILDQRHRAVYEADPSKTTCNTWGFGIFLPPTAKVVLQGQKPDVYRDNSFNTKLLVVFDVIGVRSGGRLTEYNYTEKETGWCAGNGSVYGVNRPFNLPDTGNRQGEVFWYDLNYTVLDDIELKRKW